MKQEKKIGTVYLVGAGPGDPGLMTCRGMELVKDSDVIIMDALVNPVIIRGVKAEVLYVGKRGPGSPWGAFKTIPQKKINLLMIQKALQGKKVVRLKGGDPLIFGRGSEEMEALLRKNIPYEVVPGVTSAIAAPAYAGIPLTDRRYASHVSFMTGQEKDNHQGKVEWDKLNPHQTLVILMGVHRWEFISKKLLLNGWPKNTPVAAVENGATAHQRIITASLGAAHLEFKKKRLVSPAILIVGRVASLGKTFSWLSRSKPLFGKKIVITRAEFQTSAMGHDLREKGADVILCPSIKIKRLTHNPKTNQMFNSLKKGRVKFDWIIFLSANGVRTFAEGLDSAAPLLKKASICTVGPQTSAAVLDLGWKFKVQAQKFNSMGILRMLGKIKGKRILIPRVLGGPKEFVKALVKNGALVNEMFTYVNEPAPEPKEFIKNELIHGVDAITFTSGSTVSRFCQFFNSKDLGIIFKKAKAVSIGPMTSKVLREHGVKNIIQAKNATAHDMVKRLCQKLGRIK